jgi:aspartate/methionine/tyrosine aminotransferase
MSVVLSVLEMQPMVQTSLMSRISARIAAIAESATLAVDGKAKALKAAGRPVIGFGAGEPDFPTPDYIVEAAAAATKVVANHRYTPAPGLPELREAIVAKTKRDSNYEITVDQVLVTNGGKQAVYQAFATIIDPGDEVLLPSPYWTTYPEAIKLAGGKSVEVFADETQNYLVTVEQLEAARTPKTKALLFCSPSNPTGSVYSPEQVKAIGEWAVKNNIWIISDEIYEHLLFDGATAPSLPVLVPALADTCIIINGVAKTYAMTGWRVGWMIGPKDVIKAAANLQSHLTSNVSNVSQRAAIAAVTGNLDLLNEVPGFNCPTPQGAFYVYPSVKGALGKPIRGKVANTSAELATIILEEVEVAAVPGEAFGPSGYLRFSYATSDEDIVEGIGRIKKLLSE